MTFRTFNLFRLQYFHNFWCTLFFSLKYISLYSHPDIAYVFFFGVASLPFISINISPLSLISSYLPNYVYIVFHLIFCLIFSISPSRYIYLFLPLRCYIFRQGFVFCLFFFHAYFIFCLYSITLSRVNLSTCRTVDKFPPRVFPLCSFPTLSFISFRIAQYFSSPDQLSPPGVVLESDNYSSHYG